MPVIPRDSFACVVKRLTCCENTPKGFVKIVLRHSDATDIHATFGNENRIKLGISDALLLARRQYVVAGSELPGWGIGHQASDFRGTGVELRAGDDVSPGYGVKLRAADVGLGKLEVVLVLVVAYRRVVPVLPARFVCRLDVDKNVVRVVDCVDVRRAVRRRLAVSRQFGVQPLVENDITDAGCRIDRHPLSAWSWIGCGHYCLERLADLVSTRKLAAELLRGFPSLWSTSMFIKARSPRARLSIRRALLRLERLRRCSGVPW